MYVPKLEINDYKSGQVYTDIVDDIFKDNLKNFNEAKLRLLGPAYFDKYSTPLVCVCGGNNGSSDWSDYLKNIAKLIDLIELDLRVDKVWIIDIDTDIPDDIFYVYIGIKLEKELEDKYQKVDAIEELIMRTRRYLNDKCKDVFELTIDADSNEDIYYKTLEIEQEMKQMCMYIDMIRLSR